MITQADLDTWSKVQKAISDEEPHCDGGVGKGTIPGDGQVRYPSGRRNPLHSSAIGTTLTASERNEAHKTGDPI